MTEASSEAQLTAEVRAQGKDMFFQWYLLERRLRVTIVAAISPIAKPILNWMVRKIG